MAAAAACSLIDFDINPSVTKGNFSPEGKAWIGIKALTYLANVN